jgi:hypothetical protein
MKMDDVTLEAWAEAEEPANQSHRVRDHTSCRNARNRHEIDCRISADVNLRPPTELAGSGSRARDAN